MGNEIHTEPMPATGLHLLLKKNVINSSCFLFQFLRKFKIRAFNSILLIEDNGYKITGENEYYKN